MARSMNMKRRHEEAREGEEDVPVKLVHHESAYSPSTPWHLAASARVGLPSGGVYVKRNIITMSCLVNGLRSFYPKKV